MKRWIADLNALADAYERGAPQSEIAAIEARIGDTVEQVDAQLTTEEKKALRDKHLNEFFKASRRVMQAMHARGQTKPLPGGLSQESD